MSDNLTIVVLVVAFFVYLGGLFWLGGRSDPPAPRGRRGRRG